MWVCEELGLKFKFIEKGRHFGGLDDPEYLALDPNGRIPTLVGGDLVISESAVCARYLASRYGKGTLWPDNPIIRAQGDKWMDWHLGTLRPAFKPVYDALIRASPEQRENQSLALGMKKLTHTISILDRAFECRNDIAGDRFSFGDISVGIGAYRWFNIPINRPDLKNLRAWYDRLSERPAYQKYIMRSLS